MSQLLAGVKLLRQDGSLVDAEEHLKDKVRLFFISNFFQIVGLYFSAGWCPPCRAFTPKLKRFYEAIVEEHNNFEVIFVSRDKEETDLLEYFNDHHGNWTAIPFGDKWIQELLTKYEVKTIPAMVIIKPDGTVVVHDARTEVQEKGSEPYDLLEEWETFFAM